MAVLLSLGALTVGCGSSSSSTSSSSSALGLAAYAKALDVFNHATEVRYFHLHQPAPDQVRPIPSGLRSFNDCSGFVGYLINQVAPMQYQALYAYAARHHDLIPYPGAATYASFLTALDANSSRQSGWRGVPSPLDLQRGDVLAWLAQKGNAPKTGASTTCTDNIRRGVHAHVMLVIDHPGPVATATVDGKTVRYVAIHIIDSTNVLNFGPVRTPPKAGQTKQDGVAEAYVRVVIDDNDRPIAKWVSPRRAPIPTRVIGFGHLIAQ